MNCEITVNGDELTGNVNIVLNRIQGGKTTLTIDRETARSLSGRLRRHGGMPSGHGMLLGLTVAGAMMVGELVAGQGLQVRIIAMFICWVFCTAAIRRLFSIG